MFDRFEMRSKVLGHDGRFFYLQQSMWRGEEAVSSVLYRVAVVGNNGIVPTTEVATEMGHPEWEPQMPEWVQDWIAAENLRVWPPET